MNKGIIKVVATAFFLLFGVETLGRKVSLFISAMGMGITFYIIGAILKIHPPTSPNANVPAPLPSPASKAMAATLYVYVCFYPMGWGKRHHLMDIVVYRLTHYSRYAGPLFWVYLSEIFPTRTRHYDLAFAGVCQ